MKKIMAILIMLSMLFSAGLPVLAAPHNDRVTDKAGLLAALGIIVAPESEAALAEPVTRRDFAVAMARMLNIDLNTANTNRYYVDLSENDLAWSTINALVEHRILTMDEERTFRPNDIITWDEAASALVKALGIFNLDYASCVQVARSIGILDGVSVGALTLSDVVTALHNTLNTGMYTYSGGRNILLNQGNQTLMEVYHDLYHAEGIVNAINDTALTTEQGNKRNTIQVGDTVIRCDLADPYQYLGYYVSAYYTNQDDPELVYLSITGRTNSLRIDIDQFRSYDSDSRTISYYTENGRTRTARLSNGANIVKNGENTSDNISGSFADLKNGEINLIDADRADGYETVVINTYENVVVQNVDAANHRIFGKYGKVIDLSDDSVTAVITGTTDAAMDLSGITAGNVVSLYSSSRLNRLVVSGNVQTGQITTMLKDDGKTIITVGGTVYTLDSDFAEKSGVTLEVGQTVELHIDAYGKVADAVVTQTSGTLYAWLAQYAVEGSFEDTVRLRLYTQNNEFLETEVDSRVRIDGAICKTAAEIIDALAKGNENIAEQLVIIKLNDDKKVTYIDTVYEGTEANGLFISAPSASNTYFSGQSLLGPLIRSNSSTKVFVIPQSERYKREPEAYNVTTVTSFFLDWVAYTVEGYRTGQKDKLDFAEAVLVREDLLGTGQKREYQGMMIVSDVSTVWDEETGEILPQLDFVSGRQSLSYKCAEGYDPANDPNIRIGNVIKITTNKNSEVTSTTLLYGETTSNPPTVKKDSYTYTSWTATNQTICGYITDLSNGLMGISLTPDGEPVLALLTSGIGVGVYDSSRTQSVFSGDESDLMEAMNYGYKIVVNFSRGVTRSFAVIKEN